MRWTDRLLGTLSTAWTLRLAQCVVTALLLVAVAPLVADSDCTAQMQSVLEALERSLAALGHAHVSLHNHGLPYASAFDRWCPPRSGRR